MSPSQKNENEARTKLGKTFGVAAGYITEAKILKQTAPEKFEAVILPRKGLFNAIMYLICTLKT